MLNKEQALIVAFRGQEIEYRTQDNQDWMPVGPTFMWENAGSVQFRVKPVVRYEKCYACIYDGKLSVTKTSQYTANLSLTFVEDHLVKAEVIYAN